MGISASGLCVEGDDGFGAPVSNLVSRAGIGRGWSWRGASGGGRWRYWSGRWRYWGGSGS